MIKVAPKCIEHERRRRRRRKYTANTSWISQISWTVSKQRHKTIHEFMSGNCKNVTSTTICMRFRTQIWAGMAVGHRMVAVREVAETIKLLTCCYDLWSLNMMCTARQHWQQSQRSKKWRRRKEGGLNRREPCVSSAVSAKNAVFSANKKNQQQQNTEEQKKNSLNK